MQIETARLMLKPISENDWELFKELHQSNEVIKYVSEPFSDSEIKERFTARLGQWNKLNLAFY